MFGSEYLLIPGPTPVPERVMQAMNRPIINHRGPEFHEIMADAVKGIRKVYKTENAKIAIYPSSGTGVLEAAVSNFVSPGDKVLVCSIGNFGQRLIEIATAFEADVMKLEYEYGTAVNPEEVKKALAADVNHEIKAVLVTHNETSTGVFNDLKAISEARGNHPAILIVDSVSGLGAVNLEMDNWKLDVVLSGSQKAFMLPPGIGIMAVSEKAYAVYEKNTNSRRYYWDLGKTMKFQEKGETPFTPPVPVYFGLRESLKMLEEEGVDNALSRHMKLRNAVRAGLTALGLKLVAPDEIASPAVTAVYTPAGIAPGEIRKIMLNDYNMVISGGQGKLTDTTIRIGHLGYVRTMDLVACMAALEMTLTRLGVQVELGAGVKAMQKVIMG